MPYYRIKAVDSSGKEVVRSLEADNDFQLISFLNFLNLTPVSVSRMPYILGKIQRFFLFRSVKRKDLIDLFENLQLIVRSGVPLSTGMWDLAEESDNPAIRDMLQDIAYRIQTGMSLSSAMARYEKVLGPIAVNLIKIGEETGTLEKVFGDISAHYRRMEEFTGKVRQALIYPAFALVTVAIALLFWLLYVMPRLSELFSNLRVDLPAITVAVLNVSHFIGNYFPFITLLLTLLFISFLILRRKNEKFRYVTDKILLKIPIVGTVLLSFNYAFFSEYMKLMISAGISLYDTLQILEKSFNNRVFKKAIALLRDHVSTGGSVSSGMKKSQVFPSLMIRMVGVGEETGALDEQLGYLSEHYYTKLDHITQNIAKIIEPVMIITVGVFMGIIMISLILPIYDLIGKIGREF